MSVTLRDVRFMAANGAPVSESLVSAVAVAIAEQLRRDLQAVYGLEESSRRFAEILESRDTSGHVDFNMTLVAALANALQATEEEIEEICVGEWRELDPYSAEYKAADRLDDWISRLSRMATEAMFSV